MKQEYKKAFVIYSKACDLKNTSASNNKGELNYTRLATEQEYTTVFAYYYKDCDLENYGACYNLGVLYKNG